MRRLAAPLTAIALLLTACTGDSDSDDASGDRSSAPTISSTDGPDETSDLPGTTTPSPTATEEPERVAPVSLDALMVREYDGRRLRLGREVLRTPTQVQHEVTYRSGDLTISGVIAVPVGKGPFPTVVLAHGYIDPAVYVTGQGMTRERAWFADRGYIALHVDYRGHAGSSDTGGDAIKLRLGYAADVIDAVLALRDWDGPVDDDRIALVGRSMGGGVVQQALAVQPGLVGAGVVFASISSDAGENFNHFTRTTPGGGQLEIERYGDPDRPGNRDFWRGVSVRNYFDQVTEPVLIHHGSLDTECPPRWSEDTNRLMKRAGVDATLARYPGEGHAFGPQFFASMERTDRFLRRQLG